MTEEGHAYSISFENFGHPTSENLWGKAYARGIDPNKVSPEVGIGGGGEFREPREYFVSRRIFRPIEFQQPDKGEDRIYAGNINGFPTVIVADGVTGSGSGDGKEAAEEVMLTTMETMAEGLKPGLSTLEVYNMLENAYKNSSSNMKEKKMSGGSTLLIGFLYEHKQENKPPRRMWYYAYKGDGDIIAISPNRLVDGIPCAQYLVTSQKVRSTAGVSSHVDNIAPVIGSVVYTPNDILYVNSDGFSSMNYGMNKWLMKKNIANLQAVIYKELKDGLSGKGGTGIVKPEREIANTIKDYPFRDDAVLGIIGTEMGRGSRRRSN